MHPLTLDCPKPLLPVGGRTLLEHQVERLAAAGAERIVVSTGYRHEDFADVVARSRAAGVDVVTTREEEPLGTGGGLREALRALPGAETVIVLNGDLLTGHDLRAQVARLELAPSEVLACLHVRRVPDPQRYGSVLLGPGHRITEFAEKSAAPPAATINAGTYVVRQQLLEQIPARGRVSLERDVFPLLVDASALVGHPQEAYFLDVGSPAALLRANRDHVRGRLPGTDAKGDPHRESLCLPGADVAPTARVTGGSVIHPGAVVGPGAEVTGSLVLPGADIGAGSVVRESVVGRRVVVGARARLLGCALGSGQRVAPGERLDQVLRPAEPTGA